MKPVAAMKTLMTQIIYFPPRVLMAGCILAVLVSEPARAATMVIADNYSVTTTTTGFAPDTGVNYGIDPPTTRLAGTAAANLRHLYTTSGQRSTSKYGINSERPRSLDATGIGRFTLSVDDAVERLKGVRLVCLGDVDLGRWRLANSYPAAQTEVLGVLPKLPAPVLSLAKANKKRRRTPRQGRAQQ